MLGSFREKVLSWGAKILFVLLIASFMLWGVGDYIGPTSRTDSIATIGNAQVSGQDLDDQVRRGTTQLRQVFGQQISDEQARALGVVSRSLDTLVQRTLFIEGARSLGLYIDDKLAARLIRDDQRFKTATGQFDRNLFNLTLNRSGYSEGRFVSLYRSDMLQNQMLSPLAVNKSASHTLTNAIYRYRNEKRVAEFVRLKHSSLTDIPAPDTATLAKYHKDNAARFTAPEYRAVTLVRMQAEDIAGEIDVSEDKIKEEYESRLNEFSQPERRKLQQILLSDLETAKKASKMLSLGGEFGKVASEVAKLSVASLDLGTLSKDQLPLPELANAAFLLAPNSVSQPIQTSLGWHILRVVEVLPASRKTLGELRDRLKKEIALSIATDSLHTLANKFEDELGAGATLQEAADKMNFKVENITGVDARGQDMTGKPVKSAVAVPDILRSTFETDEGQDSPLTDVGNAGYFVLRVDKITAPVLRPLNTIRNDVAAAWRAEQQAKSAGEITTKLLDQMKGGKTLKDVAKQLNSKIVTTKAFTRTGVGLGQGEPRQMVGELFGVKVGSAVVVADQGEHIIARLKEIISANPVADATATETLRAQLSQNLANDLTIQLANALRAKIGVSIDQSAIDGLYGGAGAAPARQQPRRHPSM